MPDEIQIPPGAGERRAIGGYYPQYRVAALLILRALRRETLRWIRLADPAAGRVDDIQIGSENRVDAFQVKWARSGGSLSFRELVEGDALLTDLADGWKRLRAARPGARVVVHLVTNRVPAPRDDVAGTHRSTARFLAEAWQWAKNQQGLVIANAPDEWRPAFERLEQASGLSPTEFVAFVDDCELEFSFRVPEPDPLGDGDEEVFFRDSRTLTEALFQIVADPAQPIELSCDELLARLGWRERVEFRSRHEFPVDERLYEPVGHTVRQLEDALGTLGSGYAAVLGSPGSGKSTLLTRTLRERPERVIRYYAYVPDAPHPLVLRGETTNFLHDIVLSLDHAGFRVGEALSRNDRAQLINRFHKQLQLLSESWHSTGQKTLILIDGLDHIEREQQPQHSLLRDLPLPEQVPKGVLFILGSQTDQLSGLPSQIQHMIQQPGRRIEMSGLSRDAVYRVLEETRLPGLGAPETRERIFQLSGGHPLALNLLLNRFRDVVDSSEIELLLNETEAYAGDIERQYHAHWRQFENDDDLVHLLGLAARMRGVVDLHWIEQWAQRAVVGRFRRQLARYFRREASDRWYFFHNSLRLFVIKRTRETAPGESDPSRDSGYHQELAEHCGRSSGYWAWEELFHRVSAGQDDVVLQRATPIWFRAQLIALRPIDAIETDIRLALRSVAVKQDIVALTRLNLIRAEMGQRSQNLEDFPLIGLLLKARNYDVALTHIRDGNRLRISQRSALRLSRRLLEHGLESEARRLFDLSEPLDILGSSQTIVDEHQQDKSKTLEIWASVAPSFRDLDEIVTNIARLRYRFVRVVGEEGTDESATRDLRNDLLFQVGLQLLEDARWDDVARVLAVYDRGSENDRDWRFWLQVHAWQRAAGAGEASRASELLQNTREASDVSQLTDEQRVVLAQAIHRITEDVAASRALIAGLQQPELVTDLIGRENGIRPFLQRFRLNRLLAAFGEERPLREVVPSDQPRNEGNVYFERGLCIIARIWGRAWRGSLEDPALLTREVSPLFQLFYRSWEETRDWLGWHSLQGLRPEFYRLLTEAVSQHGAEAVQQLADAFEEQWRGQSAGYWPVAVKRSILMSLFDADISVQWVTERLEGLEAMMFHGEDISDQLSACSSQANAWFRVGDAERANRWIARAVELSLGVGYRKDYQTNDWIHWLKLVNQIEPERAAERILLFAKAIPALAETTEGRASTLAANELLKAAFAWSPRRGVSLFQYFIGHGVISTTDSLGEILGDCLDARTVDADIALHTLADFLMPITRIGEEKLTAALIRALPNSASVPSAAGYLIHQSSTRGLPSARRPWRRGIASAVKERGIQLIDLGLSEDDLRPDREQGSRSLRLSDGSELSSEEVETRATSLTAFETLLEQESERSSFNWEPLLRRFSAELTLIDIERLVPKVQKGYRAPFALSILSEAAARLGARDRAWDLGLQALDLSREYGWDRWMDGGSRIAAFTALVRANPLRGRQLAYETLVRDGGGGAGNLDEILPLLSDDLPIKEIWAETEQYVRVLFEGLQPEDDGPLGVHGEEVSENTVNQAIVDLVARHLDSPARLVAQSAQRACARLLLKSKAEAQRAIVNALRGSDGDQERTLHVLEAVGFENPAVVTPFRGDVTALIDSRNLAIAWAAERICELCAWGIPSRSRQTAELPEVYDLALPPPRSELIGTDSEIRSQSILPDTRDVRELISAFDIQFDTVADAAGIPRTNVYYRAVQLMEELAPKATWSAQGERRLRSALDRADLKFTFLRPRAVTAKRSLFYVVSEFLDAGRLTTDVVDTLKPLFTFDDSRLLLIEPSIRPAAIPPIHRRERYTERLAEWVDRIDESHDVLGSEIENGWKIISEHTTLRILEWETPTEMRDVSIHYGVEGESTEPKAIPDMLASQVAEYWTARVRPPSSSLAVRNNAFMYDSLGARWLAFNPEVARDLGWQPGDTPLSWKDEGGQTVARTIWWSDGGLQHHPPSHDDETGEGWVVVVSPEAWTVLLSRYPRLSRRIVIQRQFTEERHEMKRVRGWTEPVSI